MTTEQNNGAEVTPSFFLPGETTIHRLYRNPISRGEGVPHGNGQPIYALPGWLQSGENLKDLVKFLNVLEYQAADWGKEYNWGSSEYQQHVLLQKIRQEKRDVYLVGYGFGGVIASQLAYENPEAIKGVVAIGSPLIQLDKPPIQPTISIFSTGDYLVSEGSAQGKKGGNVRTVQIKSKPNHMSMLQNAEVFKAIADGLCELTRPL